MASPASGRWAPALLQSVCLSTLSVCLLYLSVCLSICLFLVFFFYSLILPESVSFFCLSPLILFVSPSLFTLPVSLTHLHESLLPLLHPVPFFSLCFSPANSLEMSSSLSFFGLCFADIDSGYSFIPLLVIFLSLLPPSFPLSFTSTLKPSPLVTRVRLLISRRTSN